MRNAFCGVTALRPGHAYGVVEQMSPTRSTRIPWSGKRRCCVSRPDPGGLSRKKQCSSIEGSAQILVFFLFLGGGSSQHMRSIPIRRIDISRKKSTAQKVREVVVLGRHRWTPMPWFKASAENMWKVRTEFEVCVYVGQRIFSDISKVAGLSEIIKKRIHIAVDNTCGQMWITC